MNYKENPSNLQLFQIAVYGAGGFARELAWLVESCNTDQQLCSVVCFIDDDPSSHGLQLNGIPVMGLEEAYSQFTSALVVGGIGSPVTRQALMEKAAAAGFGFATLVHPRTECSSWVEIGIGTVICAGNILTTNISIGRHVRINLDCTIGQPQVLKREGITAEGYATMPEFIGSSHQESSSLIQI